jgi:tetratricopeptide (TPR) repeat protein
VSWPLGSAAPYSTGPTGSVRWKLLVFVTGVVTATTAGLTRPILRSRVVARTQAILESAQDALQRGELCRAAELAHEAVMRSHRLQCPVGPATLVLGLTRLQQADCSGGTDRLVYLAAATQHLTDAARAGVPADKEPCLIFHLACCLHARNQFPESIRLLRQTLSQYPPGRVEALRLLTLAYLDPSRLDLLQAYEANAGLIQEPGLSDEMLQWSWTMRREILRQMGKRDLLADIDVSAGDQHWVGLMSRACDHFVNKEFADAGPLFASIANLQGLSPNAERRIWYYLALTAKENGDNETALSAFRHIESAHPASAEAVGAAAFTASILLNQGKYDRAVTALTRVIRLANPELAGSLPVEAPSLTRLLSSTIHKLRERKQFEQAILLVDTYRRVAPGTDADHLAIQLYESCAAARLEQAKAKETAESNQLTYYAEELYRKAGSLSLAVADTPSHVDESDRWIWKAANDFVAGRGYVQAVAALERFLDLDDVGRLRAPALALLCIASENSGRADLVPDVAERCIVEFPDDPATVTARYYLARSMIGFGQFDQAETHLRAAIGGNTADADPSIVQQTRLALAHLLCDQRRDGEAISQLRELIANAPDRDKLFDVRLLLGDCLHRRAQLPAASAAESQTEHAKLHYQQRKDADLDEALEVFSGLQRQLAALERSGQLDDVQADCLRRCRWGMADCLYEADRVEDALKLYKLLAQLYSDPTDWFAIQLQIANCHVRLNRIETAVAVIRAAHVRLAELPPDAREHVLAGMAPERWREWLEWGTRM